MRAFFISLAFTLAAGFSWISSTQVADAQSSGFPSRPTFQQTTIRSASAPVYQYETDAPANEKSYVIETSGGIWVLGTATDAAPTTRIANAITVDRNGTSVTSINMTATAVNVNAQPILRYVMCHVAGTGVLQTGGTGCASSSRSGLGTYTVNFSTAFSSTPICVTSARDIISAHPSIFSTAVGSVNIQGWNGVASASDVSFNVICYGT